MTEVYVKGLVDIAGSVQACMVAVDALHVGGHTFESLEEFEQAVREQVTPKKENLYLALLLSVENCACSANTWFVGWQIGKAAAPSDEPTLKSLITLLTNPDLEIFSQLVI